MKYRTRPGRTLAAGVAVIAVVAVATILSVFFKGGSGSGAGEGTGPAAGTGATAALPSGSFPQTQSFASAPIPAVPERPLRVKIEESKYLVQGRELDLNGLLDLAAKVPEGSGLAVEVERAGTSRARAEEDLKEALIQKGIKYAFVEDARVQ